MRNLNLHIIRRPKPAYVELPNEITIESKWQTFIKLRLSKNYRPKIKFSIVEMSREAILGKGWLAEISDEAVINWKQNTFSINGDLIQRLTKPKGRPLLSAMQFKNALRTEEQAYVCVVKERTEVTGTDINDTQDEAIQEILDQYQDVFPDELPKEMPPSRTVDHKSSSYQEPSR
ncbi:hypothetical protein BGX34_002159 [Mortierella sp. NVP85]|nr:hypothetical protein BGX34_002159 [Mortierella sp. NVP85]